MGYARMAEEGFHQKNRIYDTHVLECKLLHRTYYVRKKSKPHYFQMVENLSKLIRTPQNHPRNSIINLSKATNGVKNFINERRRSTFGGLRQGYAFNHYFVINKLYFRPRRPSSAKSEASSVFSGVSQDGMSKIMQTRSQR